MGLKNYWDTKFPRYHTISGRPQLALEKPVVGLHGEDSMRGRTVWCTSVKEIQQKLHQKQVGHMEIFQEKSWRFNFM